MVAYAGRDDSPETIDEAVNRAKMTLAVFGAAFIGDDAAPDAGEMWINVTYGVAAAALLLAILLLVVRSNPFRLLVGLLGAGMTAYYVYAAIDLKSDIDKSNESPYGTTLDTDGYYTWIIVLLVVWAAVALFAILAGLSRSASGPRQGSGYGAAPNYYGQ
ncbi:hypothetical protein [Antrihabitans sp. YC2-6]|uniref:hypothetical protein n=1 Tax=Antrihabitans sp. YC2-6 TaxID=2799498 RepID=UPI0018F2B8F8|nr:hypothetical protein [Antrihabitans sp. YC2-6]MBJ8346561.1 hypothetical protein [Antrihabitans sp. YC2-6]